jgi:hypothetical protein
MWNRAKRHGIEMHAPVCQSELMKNLATMDMHLYPTDFIESSCTATMMSLASGCVVGTSNLGALPEQRISYLVDGHPGSEEYQEKFINNTIVVMKDKSLLKVFQSEALAARRFDWKLRASEWVNLIKET